MMDIQLKGYEVTWNDDNVYFEHDEYGEDAGIIMTTKVSLTSLRKY